MDTKKIPSVVRAAPRMGEYANLVESREEEFVQDDVIRAAYLLVCECALAKPPSGQKEV